MHLLLLLALNLTRIDAAAVTPVCIDAEGFFAPCTGVTPIEAIADPLAADLGWNATGTALDLGFTSLSLKRCKGCREQNPLGWDSEARIALKIASGVATGTTCYYLRRKGHAKAATIIRWLSFSIQAAAATNNAIHAIRGR